MGGESLTAHRLIISPYRAHILCAHDRVSASYASERLKSIRLYFLYFLGDCIPSDADARNDAALRIDYDQNGVVSSPFIAATVRLILRVCCHNPAMKSSDSIQRSDSCSLGVRVFWLARFPGVAYVAFRFMRVRSYTQDSVRGSLGSPKAALRWVAGCLAGRLRRFART